MTHNADYVCDECGDPVDIETAHGSLTTIVARWWHEECCPECTQIDGSVRHD